MSRRRPKCPAPSRCLSGEADGTPSFVDSFSKPEACPGHGVSEMTPAESLLSEDEQDEFLERQTVREELGQLRK